MHILTCLRDLITWWLMLWCALGGVGLFALIRGRDWKPAALFVFFLEFTPYALVAGIVAWAAVVAALVAFGIHGFLF